MLRTMLTEYGNDLYGSWYTFEAYNEGHVYPNHKYATCSYVNPKDLQHYKPSKLWFAHKYLGYGDYSDSCAVEVANYRYFEENYHCKKIAYVESWHDSHQVYLRGDLASKVILEVLDELADYPVLDESLMSEVEMNWENEAWDYTIKDDFHKALIERCNDLEFKLDLENLTNNQLAKLFRVLSETANEYWCYESNAAWIDAEKIASFIGTTCRYIHLPDEYKTLENFYFSEQTVERILFPELYLNPNQLELIK